ncbi:MULTISPECIES: hypothetical protein [unclassified Mesorhizobium]|uniref:hypothetical protein n=1 Tax=unclassified Mesorhizobium TaxID=325217 RepID=UPI001093AF4C|nr:MULTISPECIES: hypothetical protein [unclassified Mesorhizobium]TGT90933.1 hypothetical protein EN804_06255 [Mesorhizobium sp. M8A.F.Ca.ET.161.01.1.1]TGV43787.1 hypothetical protein EN785_07290 [Mesorhizobium sp. M8A.F.Ca.ET.142.01.1.1]
MAIIYERGTRANFTPTNMDNVDGTRAFLSHYNNYLFLKFVANNPESTLSEKLDAEGELLICEKKLEFWEKHPKFVLSAALNQIKTLKSHYRMDFGDLKYPTLAPRGVEKGKTPFVEFRSGESRRARKR